MSYVIESHIPAPEWVERNGPPKTDLRLALEGLLPGQSFLMETQNEYQRARTACQYLSDRRFSGRKVPGEGWRMWRIA